MRNKSIPPPDSSKRRHDPSYYSELITRSGLSVRRIAELVGFSERTLRYFLKGEADPPPYTVQYAMEALAHHATGDSMNAVVRDEARREDISPAPTVWHRADERPITQADEGKLVVGKDRFGVGFVGIVGRDGFGLTIKEWHPQAVDARGVAIDRVAVYAVLDPPG